MRWSSREVRGEILEAWRSGGEAEEVAVDRRAEIGCGAASCAWLCCAGVDVSLEHASGRLLIPFFISSRTLPFSAAKFARRSFSYCFHSALGCGSRLSSSYGPFSCVRRIRKFVSCSRLSVISLRSAGWPLRRCSIARKMRSRSRSSPSVRKSFYRVSLDKRAAFGKVG